MPFRPAALAIAASLATTAAYADASVLSAKGVARQVAMKDGRISFVLTETGAKRLAEAECALAAVENEVLGALDDSQREVLYTLLLQAARGSDVSCPLD